MQATYPTSDPTPEKASGSSASSGDRSPSPDRARNPTALEHLWHLFSSVRFAIGLLLGIAVLSALAIALPQAPADVEYGSARYFTWLQLMRSSQGPIADLLSALQLYTVTSSIWMRLLLGLLTVSVIICTLNRAPRIVRSALHPVIRLDDGSVDGPLERQEIQLEARQGGVARVKAVLSKAGYRISRERAEGDAVYIYADRNRYGPLGTLVSHLAIVMILAGTVVTGIFGSRNNEFVVPEGATRPVGMGTNLTVQLVSFVDQYYPSGPPKDYASDLILYDSGREVDRQVVRVNEPLSYGGVRFHQSFFGPAAQMRVADSAGNVLFDDGVALAFNLGGYPRGVFQFGDQNMMAIISGPATDLSNSVLQPGQIQIDLYDASRNPVGSFVLAQGQPKSADDLEFTFVRERQFTGLQVVQDPGAPIIFVAAFLLVAGMCSVFYFPHRRCWVRARRTGDGGEVVTIAGAGSRAPGLAQDLRRIASTIATGPVQEELAKTEGPRAGVS